MLLGAARLLKLHENEIEGTVKLMFQPGEEILAGAKDMIDHGVLSRPSVDAAMMIHAETSSLDAAGKFNPSVPGVIRASCDFFSIQVKGSGCHGSKPNQGIDPITTAARVLLALQQLHARELPITDRAVLTIGSISGGTAPNVIPDEVLMRGSLRTFDEATRAFMKQRIAEIAKNTAAAFRAQAEVFFESGTPTVVNDRALTTDVTNYLCELVGSEGVIPPPEEKQTPEPGSEDFGYISHLVPSLMLELEAGKGCCYPLHHAKITFDERVLPLGAAAYAYAAVRWLADHKQEGATGRSPDRREERPAHILDFKIALQRNPITCPI